MPILLHTHKKIYWKATFSIGRNFLLLFWKLNVIPSTNISQIGNTKICFPLLLITFKFGCYQCVSLSSGKYYQYDYFQNVYFDCVGSMYKNKLKCQFVFTYSSSEHCLYDAGTCISSLFPPSNTCRYLDLIAYKFIITDVIGHKF